MSVNISMLGSNLEKSEQNTSYTYWTVLDIHWSKWKTVWDLIIGKKRKKIIPFLWQFFSFFFIFSENLDHIKIIFFHTHNFCLLEHFTPICVKSQKSSNFSNTQISISGITNHAQANVIWSELKLHHYFTHSTWNTSVVSWTWVKAASMELNIRIRTKNLTLKSDPFHK